MVESVGWPRRGGQRCRRAGPLSPLYFGGMALLCAVLRTVPLEQAFYWRSAVCWGFAAVVMVTGGCQWLVIMHKTSQPDGGGAAGLPVGGLRRAAAFHRECAGGVFTAQDVGYTVTLLTSDQQSEDSAACKPLPAAALPVLPPGMPPPKPRTASRFTA